MSDDQAEDRPAWAGALALQKAGELIGQRGDLWNAFHHAYFDDVEFKTLAPTVDGLIEHAREKAPADFDAYFEEAIGAVRRRESGASFSMPGRGHAATALATDNGPAARLIAEVTRNSAQRTTAMLSAARRVARDYRVNYLSLKSELHQRAVTLLGFDQYRFVGLRLGDATDRVPARLAADQGLAFDWFANRITLPAGKVEGEVWERVTVECTVAQTAPQPTREESGPQDDSPPPSVDLARTAPARRAGGANSIDDSLLLGQVRAALAVENPPSVRAAILQHIDVRTAEEQDTIVHRVSRKLRANRQT